MGQQARVLVIDDSLANAEALAASLVADGLETYYALSGVEALQKLTFWRPHLFIVDINMPEHDGFAVARVLRSIGSTCDAGIIAFTALGRDEFIAGGEARDFDGYCQKGGTHTLLLALINGMLVLGFGGISVARFNLRHPTIKMVIAAALCPNGLTLLLSA
ncbi:response regulator [Paraburkholderia aspalathi]|nr:response regulator [Paraburkholderia aspalathi]